MSYHFFSVEKYAVKTDLSRAIQTLSNLAAQEANALINEDSLEIESHNLVSCPPHFSGLIQVLKNMKQLQKLIEDDTFASLNNPDDEKQA